MNIIAITSRSDIPSLFILGLSGIQHRAFWILSAAFPSLVKHDAFDSSSVIFHGSFIQSLVTILTSIQYMSVNFLMDWTATFCHMDVIGVVESALVTLRRSSLRN